MIPKSRFKSQLASMKPGEESSDAGGLLPHQRFLKPMPTARSTRLLVPIQLFGQDELVDAEGRRTGAAVNLRVPMTMQIISVRRSNRWRSSARSPELQNIYDVMIVLRCTVEQSGMDCSWNWKR